MLRFVQKTDGHTPSELVEAGIAPRLAQLLFARGIDTLEAAQRYLTPSMEHLHDPMLMQDMDKAVECIRDAIAKGETIAVFGDYDVDGVTATAILLTYLKKCGAKTTYYIPDRHGEGYGLNVAAISELAKTAQLLITVDCGITSAHEVAVARSLGMRVIVTDHHQIPEQLPQCEAVLNPLLGSYPFRRLCGAGVAFKLVQALGGMEAIEPLWELAALATVADIVPLMDENRVIVSFGLKALNQSNRPGIVALIESAGLAGQMINSGHIGFQIAPRINAGGRLALASRGVELLTTRSMTIAREIAAELESENIQRRELEMDIFRQADEMVAEQVDFLRDRAIVLSGEGWNPGVIGLAASRLVEKYRWPVILFSQDGDTCVGSARSIPGVNIHAALVGCGKEMFERFGGHAQAAGLTILTAKMPEFKRMLNRVLNAHIEPEAYLPTQEYDLELEMSEIDEELIKSFGSLQPTGFGNPSPVFCLRGVLPMDCKRVGKDGAHLKLRLASGDELRDAIAFRMGELSEKLPERVDVLFSPSINVFRDVRSVQCEVKKMAPFQPARAFLSECTREQNGFFRAILGQIRYNMPCDSNMALDVLPMPFMQVESFVKEKLSDGIQGTLLIVHTLSGLKKWTTHLAVMGAQLDYAIGKVDDRRCFNTLLAMPDADAYAKELRAVVLLDGTTGDSELAAIRRSCPNAQIVYTSDMGRFMSESAQQMTPTDDQMRTMYKAIRALRDEYAPLSEIVRATQMQTVQCISALSVLEELSLIEWSTSPWRVALRPMKKCDLSSSNVLSKLRALVGADK